MAFGWSGWDSAARGMAACDAISDTSVLVI
jgi:hypothetical protein